MSALVFCLACDNVDDDNQNQDGDAESNEEDGEAVDGDESDNNGLIAGRCNELHLDLHEGSGQAFVDLSTMTVVNEDTDVYDFVMVNEMPNPPSIYLGPNVVAQNLGDADSFLEVVESLEDGFLEDDENGSVIGTAWESGGSGASGYEMSNDVYLLKLSSGRYGKIMVTSAKQGKITLDAYATETDSLDLTCAWPED